MLNLSKLFYKTRSKSLTSEQKLVLMNMLMAIYHQQEPIAYSPDVFDACKEQLIALLTFIIERTENKFSLFVRYKTKVEALMADQSKIDIRSTLLMTKRNLENHLLFLIDKYAVIDLNLIDSYSVAACYSGAASNIQQALSHFHATQFDSYLEEAKKNLLLAAVKQYVDSH